MVCVFPLLIFYFVPNFAPVSANGDGLYFINLTTSDTKVPSVPTTYWCVVEKMPERLLSQKHHLVKLEPILQPHVPGLIHHVRLFGCESTATTPYNGPCDEIDGAKRCKKEIAAWGIGSAGAFILPEEAGYSIGGPDIVPYYMIEIHYNNPQQKSGLVDSSGLRLSVTSRLRPYDAGVLLIGTPAMSKSMVIPPGQRGFAFKGLCPKQCTENLPPTGIKVFGSELHAHASATKLWATIEREGKAIGDLARLDPFVPADRHLQLFDPPITIMPGDVLTTVCQYETTNRNETTFSGPGHSNEMCINFLLYYPTVEVGYCFSEPNNEALDEFFDRGKQVNATDPFANFTWTDGEARRLERLYETGPYKFSCLSKEGGPILGSQEPHHQGNRVEK
ncbi:unnamed protein product, partial [Mesorhabditis spiculigera]